MGRDPVAAVFEEFGECRQVAEAVRPDKYGTDRGADGGPGQRRRRQATRFDAEDRRVDQVVGGAAPGPPYDAGVVADHLGSRRQRLEVGPGGGQRRAGGRRPQQLRQVHGVVRRGDRHHDEGRHRRRAAKAIETPGDQERGRGDQVGDVIAPQWMLDSQDEDGRDQPCADQALSPTGDGSGLRHRSAAADGGADGRSKPSDEQREISIAEGGHDLAEVAARCPGAGGFEVVAEGLVPDVAEAPGQGCGQADRAGGGHGRSQVTAVREEDQADRHGRTQEEALHRQGGSEECAGANRQADRRRPAVPQGGGHGPGGQRQARPVRRERAGHPQDAAARGHQPGRQRGRAGRQLQRPRRRPGREHQRQTGGDGQQPGGVEGAQAEEIGQPDQRQEERPLAGEHVPERQAAVAHGHRRGAVHAVVEAEMAGRQEGGDSKRRGAYHHRCRRRPAGYSHGSDGNRSH